MPETLPKIRHYVESYRLASVSGTFCGLRTENMDLSVVKFFWSYPKLGAYYFDSGVDEIAQDISVARIYGGSICENCLRVALEKVGGDQRQLVMRLIGRSV